MNGSEHTVGGVGYAGELHFIHRNIKYSNWELASKAPNGILALAVFLNVIFFISINETSRKILLYRNHMMTM